MSTAEFFLCDIFEPSLKDDLASMEHPMFSLSTRPDRAIRRYEHNGSEITVTPSVKGRATIHDKDILIYCISQLVAAVNAGREVCRTLRLRAHDLLVATRRDTSGDGYARLREAFERLAGTRITTNIVSGDYETTSGFGLIESWEIVRRSRGGRMVSVSVTLSEWLYRAVLARSVLTLSPAYFDLRKPLERRVYELARKHCGSQRDWRVSVAMLHQKAGSDAPVRVFRAAIRKMIAADGLPDYVLSEEPDDVIRIGRRRILDPGPSPLPPEALERAREIAPGHDIYALEAEWLGWWVSSGRPRLTAPERAFRVWLEGRVAK
ncbi:replication initiator protein A [Limimaricola pyoseonensis]|uniref:Plasmid replication initiator protein n=1 Tax=Limimaricola pyoseonensis TaxID=521013 RepID=A0A1G7KIE1_9RHOB|nr:replication initiator protein A [Limimaricola pyoseonensis]SDF36957.1 Plasmid replication initiator protein [Limimaricola pyoseonensis]